MLLKRIASLALALVATTLMMGQVMVDEITAEDAVLSLLGPGVEASNISFTGADGQRGYLTGAEGTIFPVAEGVLLSTDCAENFQPTPDPGCNIFGSTVSGDADLLDIANSVPPLINQNFSVSSANDVCILEFDFVPQGDTVSFNYSFGSDEYLSWVNTQYNDVFAFFLSGPGLSGPYDAPAEFPDGAINIAFLPDTDPELPITISSVNNVLNTEYYIDNPSNTDVNQNGFTVTLTATSVVECGETYHIKLAIADGTDTALESIVVIEAGSFSSSEPGIVTTVDDTGISVPDNTLIEGCLDGVITVTKAQCDESTELDLIFGGTAGMVADYEFIETPIIFEVGENTIEIPITTVADGITEGTETIDVSFQYVDNGGDTLTAQTTIDIIDYVAMVTSVEDVYVCPGGTSDGVCQIENGISPYTTEWSDGGSGTTNTYSQGSEGSYFAVTTDFCEEQDTAFFEVFEPSPLELGNISPFYCVGLDTDALVDGGTFPYDFTFSSDSLIQLEGGGFTSDYEGIYEVTVVDDCGDSFDFVLEYRVCDTTIPNVFTPTNSPNDVANNAFVIDGLAGFPGSRLEVYNRWGNLVYENDNYFNTWDGEENPDGIYYYVFERSDGETYSGYVHILRKAPE